MGRGQETTADTLLYGVGRAPRRIATEITLNEAIRLLNSGDRERIFRRLEAHADKALEPELDQGLRLLYKSLTTFVIREELPEQMVKDPGFAEALIRDNTEMNHLRSEIGRALRRAAGSAGGIERVWDQLDPLVILYQRAGDATLGPLLEIRDRQVRENPEIFFADRSAERQVLGAQEGKQTDTSSSPQQAPRYQAAWFALKDSAKALREAVGSDSNHRPIFSQADLAELDFDISAKIRVANLSGELRPLDAGLRERLRSYSDPSLTALVAGKVDLEPDIVSGALSGEAGDVDQLRLALTY